MSDLADKPAFPSTIDLSAIKEVDHPGMSYRQWLVGMTLQGILANPVYLNEEIILLSKKNGGQDWASKLAIVYADQTIACLEGGIHA